MKLHILFGQGHTIFSCEVFPPRRPPPVDSIYRTLTGLKDICPDFISVTFGAGGSQINQSTQEIASLIYAMDNIFHSHKMLFKYWGVP